MADIEKQLTDCDNLPVFIAGCNTDNDSCFV